MTHPTAPPMPDDPDCHAPESIRRLLDRLIWHLDDWTGRPALSIALDGIHSDTRTIREGQRLNFHEVIGRLDLLRQTQTVQGDRLAEIAGKLAANTGLLVTVASEQDEQSTALAEIITILRPPKATAINSQIRSIPKGSGFPMESNMQLEKLDYKSDLEDALLGPDAPNGPVDGEARWSGTDNADGSDLNGKLEVKPGGHAAIVRLPTDAATFDYTVTETYDVDDPRTPDIETISTTYHLGGAHSKATDPGGSVGAIAKGAGFPA